MSVLCTICARGGSKELKNKALKKIFNKPLISYTIRQAIKSKTFDNIVLSTDSKKIQRTGKKYGAKSWFLRPKKLSNDYCSKLLAIRHAFTESEKYFGKRFNYCVDLDITSPLRTSEDIKKSFNIFKKTKATNLISVCESKKNPYFNMVEKKGGIIKIIKKIKNSDRFSRTFSTKHSFVRRQDAPKVYEMNASIYIFTRNFLINKMNLLNKKTSFYLMPRDRSIDIDDKFDLILVKTLIKNDKKLFSKI